VSAPISAAGLCGLVDELGSHWPGSEVKEGIEELASERDAGLRVIRAFHQLVNPSGCPCEHCAAFAALGLSLDP